MPIMAPPPGGLPPNPMMRQQGGMPMPGRSPFGNQQLPQGQPMPMRPQTAPVPLVQPQIPPMPQSGLGPQMAQGQPKKPPMSSQRSSQMVTALMSNPFGKQGQQ